MNQSRHCLGCGERIVWIVTKARGRPMPCNPEVITVHFVAGEQATEADRDATWRRITLLTADGVIKRGYQLPSARQDSVKIIGRASHYTTCPKANYYRDRAALKRGSVRAAEGAPDGPR